MQIHMVNYMLRKAKKESRVSTLTLAQTRDYGSILILSSLCVEIYVQC